MQDYIFYKIKNPKNLSKMMAPKKNMYSYLIWVKPPNDQLANFDQPFY